MKSTLDTLGSKPDAKAEVPDARAAKIAEVQSVLRGSVGKVLKGKAAARVDALMEETNWAVKVSACEKPQDFLKLFEYYGISEEVWRSSKKLEKGGYGGLYRAIQNRFIDGGRQSFFEFMRGSPKQTIDSSILILPYTKQVDSCHTSDDFLQLFAIHEIPDDVWRSSGELINAGYGGLHQAITKCFSDRGGWAGFMAFMPPVTKQKIDESITKLKYSKQVEACESPADFLQLFALHKLSEVVWRNSTNLTRAGYRGLYVAISNHFREQGGWLAFISFMPSPTKPILDKSILELSFPKQVEACESPADFLQLFALHKLPEAVWRNSSSLTDNGYYGLYIAIRERFRDDGGWLAFINYMPSPNRYIIDESILQFPVTKQVELCESASDFCALFALHEISEEIWRSTGKLQKSKSGSLYDPIFNRFRSRGGWPAFLDFMDGKDEATLDAKLEQLSLEDAVALLGHQPTKLKAYLTISHPELAPDEIDQLVGHSFKRLHARRVYDYSDFKQELAAPHGITSPRRTDEAAAPLSGNAPGADCVLIQSDVSTRRVKVADDGSFSARATLAVGERNEIRITPVHHENKFIGPPAEVTIHQTGEPDDIGALVGLLDQMGVEALEGIKTDPGRHEYVVRQAEQVLIRKFSGTFAKGKDYVEGLIAEAKSPAVRKVLKAVLKRFTAIDAMQHPNVKKGAPLYFFQKYCVAEIQRAMEEGRHGIALANDPGLGKTRTALVAVNGDPATIITPNSVVTSWAEEAQRALVDNDLLVLQDMHSQDRKEQLRTSSARHCVTNVEFLRAAADDDRYGLLADNETIVVQDEAHGLLNLGTEQSKGARRLKSKFLLLLSATPAKDPKTLRRILHLLDPDDPRFSSDKAFAEAFPGNDPKALKTLNLIKQQYMIRFTKEDVLETMDPKLPLSQQKHRLPKKEYVPAAQMGGFTLTEDQCWAIYKLLLNFPEWTEAYDRYVPKDAIAREDQLRGNSNALVKTHALRQTANNPSYVGSSAPDPKGAEMLKAVDAMLAEGRKVVIFCQYTSQAQKYAELLKAHCPSVYTGIVSRQGNRMGTDGQPLLYKKNAQGAWVMDNRGLPQEDPKGKPMSALDYERLTFQNAPERRVMISTYAAGSVGVTFTAGKATIFDDLPEDVIKEIQSEDRTHRIDHEHQTHHSVKYVKMVAHYPESFLEEMKKTWVRKKIDGTYFETDDPSESFVEAPIDSDITDEVDTAYNLFFAQGTYDEVRLAGLATQRTRFRLINDGIADESELPEIKNLVV